jgi:hypothetical protein
MRNFLPLFPLLSFLALSCHSKPSVGISAELQPSWDKQLQRAATEYSSWKRVDQHWRWAPAMCRPPTPSLHRSRSANADTHGRKLYTLFAKDLDGYFELTEGTAAVTSGIAPARPVAARVGQVIVKESWIPERVDPDEVPTSPTAGEDLLHFAFHEGNVWRGTQRGPLFVMMKMEADTIGTDQGWVYGTLDDEGNVTGSGAITSCMECHVEAPNDRLFGPPTR